MKNKKPIQTLSLNFLVLTTDCLHSFCREGAGTVGGVRFFPTSETATGLFTGVSWLAAMQLASDTLQIQSPAAADQRFKLKTLSFLGETGIPTHTE